MTLFAVDLTGERSGNPVGENSDLVQNQSTIPALRRRLVGLLQFVPCLLLLFCTCWVPVGSIDFWAHAAVGRWIVHHGQVPTHNLFLWTDHSEWVAQQWLSEVLMYHLINGQSDYIATLRGVIATFLVVSTTFGVLWREWYRNGTIGFIASLAFGIAMIASRQRFQPRSETLITLLFVMILVLVRRMQDEATGRSLRNQAGTSLAIVVIVVAWSNLHGSFILPLIYLAQATLASALTDYKSVQTRLLAATTLACIPATFVNPYGPHIWSVLATLKSATFHEVIEWTPFWRAPLVDPLDLTYLVVLASAAIATLAMSRGRLLHDIVWLLTISTLYLSARRYAMFLSLTCLWIIGAHIRAANVPMHLKPAQVRLLNFYRTLRSKNVVSAAVTTLVYALWIATLRPGDANHIISSPLSDSLPVAQAAFLERAQLPGHVLNDFDAAPYIEWKVGEQMPLAIDTLQAYPYKTLKQYDDALDLNPDGLQFLKSVSCVVGRRPNVSDTHLPRLYTALHFSPAWSEIFVSPTAGPIWVRLPMGQTRHSSNPAWNFGNGIGLPPSPPISN